MGKCSGLKGGGHHRKAIDIADKKRNEKKARKKDAEAAGKRYLALQEILSGKVGSIYQDCDIYLEATSDSDGASSTELCRAHFRTDNCSNRRCKFSHDYTIAEALQNIMSGSNNNSNEYGDDNDDYAPTIPALRYLPGIIGDSMSGKRRQRNRWKQPSVGSTSREGVVEDGISSLSLESQPTISSLENALLEGSSVVNTIVACLPSNQDVLHFGLSGRYLHKVVLLDGNNGIEEGCLDVQRRKQQYNNAKLHERNEMLLKSKAIGGRLRYVVGYVIDNKPKAKKNKNKSKTKNGQRDTSALAQRMRPVLVYDDENPQVFIAFREGANCSNGSSG